jgi:hypothetical protein
VRSPNIPVITVLFLVAPLTAGAQPTGARNQSGECVYGVSQARVKAAPRAAVLARKLPTVPRKR